MHYITYKSPVGRLHLTANEQGLTALAFDANWERVKAALGPFEKGENKILRQALRELEEYFAGKRSSFSVPLAVQGTPFLRAAWKALTRIPYGRTATYGEQAARLGKPQAVRAVGRANGLNPVCIVVPCHRVVGASGSLTGYAGGLEAKKKLLALETRFAPR